MTRVLGVADRKVLHELASALVDGDAPACLAVVERLAQQGFDLPHVARDMLRHLRNLVVAKVSAGPQASRAAGAVAAGPSLRELLDLADEEIGDVVELASRAEVDDLSRLFQGFSRAFDDVVRSGQPRTALEMALVRLARRPPLLPLDELLARVGDLERRLGGAPPPGPSPRGSGGGGGPSAAARPSRHRFIRRRAAPATHGSLALVDPMPTTVAARAAGPPAQLARPRPRSTAPQRGDPRHGTHGAPSSSDCARSRPAAGVVLRACPAARDLHPRASSSGSSRAQPSRRSAPASPKRSRPSRASSAHISGRRRRSYSTSRRKRRPACERSRRSTPSDGAQKSQRARAAVEAHPLVQEAIRVFGAELRDVKLPGADG